MKRSTMTLAMCFALAPFAAHATAQHHHTIHQAQRHAISMTATAFAPVVIPAVKLDEDSDGLTRNREECNRGCVDN
jgi:hypothetical protein